MVLRIKFKEGESTKEIGVNVFKHLPKFIALNKAKIETFEVFRVQIQPTIQEGMEELVKETYKSLGADSKFKCWVGKEGEKD